MRSLIRIATIGIAALGLAACDQPPGRPAMKHVQVKLAWDGTGVTLADGHGTFTTDTGYVVEVDRFELTTYSFELMPCEQRRPPPPGAGPQGRLGGPRGPRPPGPPGMGMFGLGVGLASIGTAYAGHEVGHPPTRTGASRVELPLQAQPALLDQIRTPDIAYCAGHYLIGRTIAPEANVPAENVGVSLRLHGRYRKAADTAWQTLELESSVAHGILVDFTPGKPKDGIKVTEGDTVVVTRHLRSLFDGVDFATMDSQTIARQMLRQIVAGTSLSRESGHV